MKYSLPITALLSIVLADPGYVQVPVSVKKQPRSHSTLHRRRTEDFPITLANDFFGYFVNISIGTPGQVQEVQIDTGSSDLWVYGTQQPDNGAPAPAIYNPSLSSTSKYVDSNFFITYVDGSGEAGDYYTDDVSVGGVTVDFQFAVVTEIYDGDGVFGIASRLNEAGDNYANYPIALKQQGFIESTAYSLYLDDLESATGSLLMGGVDTSKYSGELIVVPITTNDSFTVDFLLDDQELNGVLDSGTSFTYLPDDIANSLAEQVGGTWNEEQEMFFVEKASDISVTYTFGNNGGVNITVPSSELFAEYQGRLAFLIERSSSVQDYIILGDSFLRSAYVVYDLDNGEIGIAQADYNGTGSIVPITSAGIPGGTQLTD